MISDKLLNLSEPYVIKWDANTFRYKDQCDKVCNVRDTVCRPGPRPQEVLGRGELPSQLLLPDPRLLRCRRPLAPRLSSVGLLWPACSFRSPSWPPRPFPSAKRRRLPGAQSSHRFAVRAHGCHAPPPPPLCAQDSHVYLCCPLTLSLACPAPPSLRACEKPHRCSIPLLHELLHFFLLPFLPSLNLVVMQADMPA